MQHVCLLQTGVTFIVFSFENYVSHTYQIINYTFFLLQISLYRLMVFCGKNIFTQKLIVWHFGEFSNGIHFHF